MRLKILKTKKEVAKEVADIICNQIKKKKSSVLGLSTGNTMIPLYKELVKRFKNKKVSFSKVKTFNLDEYVGLGNQDKESLWNFMDKHFFSKVDIIKENANFLNGKARNLKKECQRYENLIKKSNGIDLQILGLGRDGHVGYNEPGSLLKSRTRKVKLTPITIKDKAEHFGSIKKVPKYGLTIGIANILEARKIVLVVTGKHKASIFSKVVKEKPTKKIPATLLKVRNDVLFIADKEAASEL